MMPPQRRIPVDVSSTRDSLEYVAELRDALLTYNATPTLFRRGMEAVDVVRTENGGRQTRPLTGPVLANTVAKATTCFAVKYGIDGSPKQTPKDPSATVLERVRVDLTPLLPELRSVVDSPIVAPDGSIVLSPGFHPVTGTFYSPSPVLLGLTVPDAPTASDVEEAKQIIWRPFAEFPFVDASSAANLLALVITPLIRPFLGDALVPIGWIDAPIQATGKTLLADMVSWIARGTDPGLLTQIKSEKEWRSYITSCVRDAVPVVVLDNIDEVLRSTALAALITSATWTDREFYKQQLLELPNRTLWIATGNNMTASADMKRRIVPIRLDSGMPDPSVGRKFAIDDLRTWTADHRAELVRAVLVLFKAWHRGGARPGRNQLLASFESWSRTVGGILDVAGVPGFLGNLREVTSTSDIEQANLDLLLECIFAVFPDTVFSAAALLEAARVNPDLGAALSVFAPMRGDVGTAEVGRLLTRFRDRRTDRLTLRRLGATGGANRWAVEPLAGRPRPVPVAAPNLDAAA